METQREEGYYWVKDFDNQWMVAYWDANENLWTGCSVPSWDGTKVEDDGKYFIEVNNTKLHNDYGN